jgi:predicted MFS family arabinose efflux permease
MAKKTVGANDARAGLLILTVINFLNYIDRYVLAAVFEPIKRELRLSDAELGWTLSAFMIAYSATSPLFGRLGDVFTRKYLIACGIALWSVATAGAALAKSFWQLFVPRSIVGIGEASYATMAPGIIADFFRPERRGRALAIFYAAIPAGSAMGFVLGGRLSESYGWRSAFLIVGLPGLLLALVSLLIREPERGASEPRGPEASAAPPSLAATYRSLWRNRTYVLVTVGSIAYTFALGGLVGWMPAFLERYHSMSTARANDVFGALSVVAGFLGTFAGGFLADFLLRFTRHSYLLVSGVSMFLGAPVSLVALTAADSSVALPAMFMAEFFLFLNTGPLNAMVLGCVGPGIRATAMAVNIFFIHALGDAISPAIIGVLSDRMGLASAVLIAPAMMLASGLILVYAIKEPRSIVRDSASLR